MLEYRAHSDPDLAAHLANGPFKEKYLSPIRQNEMINILGEQITHSIVSQCNRAGAFALLADECTDKSTTKQMSLCLCFFFYKLYMIKEGFLAFPCTKSTREVLAETFIHKLNEVGINLKNIVCQGYGRESNM